MAKLIGFLCNDDSLTATAIGAMRTEIAFPQTTESPGFGFGWIQDGRTLLRTHPKPSGGSPDLVSLLSDIHSRALVAHVRDAQDEPVSALELQPFRFRRWVVARAGDELTEHKAALLDGVPGFVRSNIKGPSSDETLCHLFLAELHRRDLLEKGRTNPRGCAEALSRTMERVQSFADDVAFSAVAVTERVLVAARLERPLYYRNVRGISHMREQPLFAGHNPKPVRHPSFKAIFVTDAVVDAEAAGWLEIPQGAVLYVDADWNVRFLDAS